MDRGAAVSAGSDKSDSTGMKYLAYIIAFVGCAIGICLTVLMGNFLAAFWAGACALYVGAAFYMDVRTGKIIKMLFPE
jgi:hypothetical protein